MATANSRTSAVRTHEWPMGLGRLESVPSRYPKQMRTPAAAELERLTDVAAIRSLLLSGRPIGWDVDITRGADAPMPNMKVVTSISRTLSASARERAQRGDPGAWDDLRAQRILSRALWQRPEFLSAMIAAQIDRNIIIAAREMPLPVPDWFGELRAFDHRRALLVAMQADTWILSTMVKEFSYEDPDGHWVSNLVDRTITLPYTELSRSDLVARQRDTAVRLSKLTTCGLELTPEEAPWWNQLANLMTPNVTGAWRRVFRLRAEIELTEHALGLRSGPQSRCSDGQWIVTPESVKFSKALPDGRSATPLEVRR